MKIKPNSHDLQLPCWGPYSKQYSGISHIADPQHGLRFDLSVFPGLYRRKIEPPNVLMEGNTHVWQANADLTYFSTRHQLEWKDVLYCDVSYGKLESDSYLIRMECVNRGKDIQTLVLHYMASIHYPTVKTGLEEQEITPVLWNLPEKSVYCRGIDYLQFHRRHPLPTDSLVPDGLRPNEVRRSGFSGGSAVHLCGDDQDRLSFQLKMRDTFSHPILALRYQSEKGCRICLQGDGLSACGSLPPQAAPGIGFLPVLLSPQKDTLRFTLQAQQGELLLDSLILCEQEDFSRIGCEISPAQHVPKVWERGAEQPLEWDGLDRLEQNPEPSRDPFQNTLILKFPYAPNYYGLYWDFPDCVLRYWFHDTLDQPLRYLAHDHVRKRLPGNGLGHFSNVFLRPIPVQPGETITLYGLVCCAPSREQTLKKLENLIAQRSAFPQYHQALQNTALRVCGTGQALPYRFSQDRMMATTLTNVVYPIYLKRNYIRHNTPGRWWDSLYTWDSGFVGLGLTCCNLQRALDCLNAYLTQPGDTETAFIHHGSPVPVQFYLFQELFNRTQSIPLLKSFYPRLLPYYRFMTGQLGSSTTDRWNSGILATWDYFYNSGGWDDYPPQVAVHAQHLEPCAGAMVTTSHMILCAKLLIWVARLLHRPESEISSLQQDIARMSRGILTYCWDEASGYFGYLLHDQQKNPTGILRHNSGKNYNMGLDGVSPMIAGIVSPQQLNRLTQHLSDENALWTPLGLSTVDQSAPYYRKDGYWNGSVWMPHQWFLYKSLLDYGNGELAFRIAETALKTWKNEVDQSYNCYEHFPIVSRRGAGWHHFSGLSTPVLLWYRCYFTPGAVTTGFSGWIVAQKWEKDHRQMQCTVCFYDNATPKTVVIAMNPASRYRASINGQEVPILLRTDSAVELLIAPGHEQQVDIAVYPI